MKEAVCKHQHTLYDTVSETHVSTCCNYKCIHHCAPVSHIICDDCPLREQPEKEIQQTLDGDIYSISERETRTPEERRKILETYCFKCKFFDTEGKTCHSCGCMSHAPVDEYAKFVDFHCPLELW